MLQYKGYTKKKYQVAGKTFLNKDFLEGVSNNSIEGNMLPTHTITAKRIKKSNVPLTNKTSLNNNIVSPTLSNDKWVPKTKEDELRKFSQPIINQSDNITNFKPKHLNQPSTPLPAYEPSDLVKQTKATLAIAQLANPSNLYLNSVSAGGDIATALKYYYHGNTRKGNEDMGQAVTNFIPYMKGVSGFKDGTYILSKFDKVFNKSLNSVRVGSDIKTIDESMNRKTGGQIKRFQVAGRTQLNKEFIEGVSSNLEKHESYLRNKNNNVQKSNSVVQPTNYNTTRTGNVNEKIVNDNITDKILDDPSLYTMHQKYGKPNIRTFGSNNVDKLPGRDYYNPLTNTMAIRTEKTFLHELPHVIQRQNIGTLNLIKRAAIDYIKYSKEGYRNVKQIVGKDGSKTSWSVRGTYGVPGTMENEAHFDMQPKLYEEYNENNKQFDIERQNRKSIIPKGKLNYQWKTGGTVKKYQVAGRIQLNKPFEEGYTDKPIPNVNPINYARVDNTSYNNYKPTNQTQVTQTPITFAGKQPVQIPIQKQDIVTPGNPDTFNDNLYNRSKNSKTFSNLANNLIVPVTDIMTIGQLGSQGIKYGIKKLSRKVPTVISDSARNVNLVNKPSKYINSDVNLGKRSINNLKDNPTTNKSFVNGPPEPNRFRTIKDTYKNDYLYPEFFTPHSPTKSGDMVLNTTQLNKTREPMFGNYIKVKKKPKPLEPIIQKDEMPDRRHLPRKIKQIEDGTKKLKVFENKRNAPD